MFSLYGLYSFCSLPGLPTRLRLEFVLGWSDRRSSSLLKQEETNQIQQEFYRGTHVRVKVDSKKVARYRGRKDYPTMNVLASCSFDLKFTYILAGWEGTASDSKILKNALTRTYPLKILQGKYYLVDAGFMIKSGLITQYRRTRCHLQEYSASKPPQNHRELFNLRHASLRNAIERAFGVVKKQFPIIGNTSEPHHLTVTIKQIFLACCMIHNFLVDNKDLDEVMLRKVDAEIEYEIPALPNRPSNIAEAEDSKLGEEMREKMAREMWSDYNASSFRT